MALKGEDYYGIIDHAPGILLLVSGTRDLVRIMTTRHIGVLASGPNQRGLKRRLKMPI